MDRRQQKSRAAIVQAFTSLLQKKPFARITVQEIIDQANVGRSTFYAHFETKDELLRSMCNDIFHHVFHHALPQESVEGCETGLNNLQVKLGHVLFHLDQHRDMLRGMLRSQSGELFLGYLRGYLQDLFQRYQEEFDPRIPRDFLLHHLTGSFCETVKWWMSCSQPQPPEQVAAYFMMTLGHFQSETTGCT